MIGDDVKLILWGRCRSGRRWFWTACDTAVHPYGVGEHGWADTEDAAAAAAMEVVTRLCGGRPARITPWHNTAREALKRINAEKRRARPSNGGTDPSSVEHLYGIMRGWSEEDIPARVVAFRVTKKTAKRVYYIRRPGWPGEDPVIGSVDRQALEADGHVDNRGVHWAESDSTLYAAPPELTHKPPPAPDVRAELSRLKAEMADSHPDRGGTSAGFSAARRRYKQALDRSGR